MSINKVGYQHHCGMGILYNFGGTAYTEGRESKFSNLINELSKVVNSWGIEKALTFALNDEQVEVYQEELNKLGLKPVFSSESNHRGKVHLYVCETKKLRDKIKQVSEEKNDS